MLMEYYTELIQRWYFERRFNNEDEPPVDKLSRWAAAKVGKRNRKSANWIVTELNMTNNNRWAKAWFSRKTLKATYQQLVYPLPDVSLWVTPNDLQVVLPPALVKPQPGRPKTKVRIKSEGEEPRQQKSLSHPEYSNEVNTQEFYDSQARSSTGYDDMHLDDLC
ncbi:hypothetical protein Tco_1064857 [Tanacetum coccineum]